MKPEPKLWTKVELVPKIKDFGSATLYTNVIKFNLKGGLSTVHPEVGAAIYRGQAVQLEQSIRHVGREPNQTGQDVHRLTLSQASA